MRGQVCVPALTSLPDATGVLILSCSRSMSDEKETEVKIDEGAVLEAVKKTKDTVLSALQSYVLYGGMDIQCLP